jgi:GNAT superfamily N-acetyltransferase
LRHPSGQDVEDVLWWEGDRLLGFLGIYTHSVPTIELAGMVDPAARRRGIGTALLDAGLRLCQEREHETVLLVVPRSSVAGRSLAQRQRPCPACGRVSTATWNSGSSVFMPSVRRRFS